MIPKDVAVLDLGSENWGRFVTLAMDVLRESAPAPRRALLVFYRGMTCLKAVDLEHTVPVKVDFRGTSRLDALSRESGYPVIIALEESALMRVIGHAQRELDYTDDYFRQWGAYLRGFSREWRRTIFTYPAGPPFLPVLPHWFFSFGARLMVPGNSLLFLAITEGGKARASVVLGYRDGEFWLLSSLDSVDLEEGDLRGEGLPRAAEALEAKFGGKVRGMAVERDSLFRVLRSRIPAASALWALNSAQARLLNVPWRWWVEIVSSALVLRLLKRVGVKY